MGDFGLRVLSVWGVRREGLRMVLLKGGRGFNGSAKVGS